MAEEMKTVDRSSEISSDERRRAVGIRRVLIIGLIVLGGILATYVWLYLDTRYQSVLVDSVGLVLGIVCLAMGLVFLNRRRLDAAGYCVLATLVIGYSAGEMAWSGETFFNVVGGSLLIIVLGNVTLRGKWRAWWAAVGVYGALVLAINLLDLGPRFNVFELSPETYYLDIATTVVLALIGLWLLARTLAVITIRARLLVSFVVMALLLAVTIITLSTVMGIQNGSQRAFDNLRAISTVKESQIDAWKTDLYADLDTVLSTQVSEYFRNATILTRYETEGITPDDYQDAWNELYVRFQTYTGPMSRFEEVFLLDANGTVVVSTIPERNDTDQSQQPYFQRGMESRHAIFVPDPDAPTRMTLVVAQPVVYVSATDETIGVLAGRARWVALDQIMEERTGLGETGHVYLVRGDYLMLTASREEERGLVHSQGIDRAIQDNVGGEAVYVNHHGDSVFGVYRWLPVFNAVLLTEQDRGEVYNAVYRTVGLSTGAALVAVALAIGASLLITRSIAQPLSNLTETATAIAAGDLERVAKVERRDEVGMLAQAFNNMTARLRDLVGSLEERVAARTLELEKRSTYLEASAEVASAAASILNMDQLVQQVVESIRQRFSLYYVGLFLVDEVEEWVVLRAGTGEAGRRMLAGGHRVRIGEGMIGWCVANAQPRIASDVGEDAVRLATTELPGTRSEGALPLRARGGVIGALSVQSSQPDAFDEETIAVFQILADQVATALENARLFAESRAALEAAGRAYGELSREAWISLLRARPIVGFRSDERGLAAVGKDWRPEMLQALQEGRIVYGDGTGKGIVPLAIPIKVRDEVIGVLDTFKPAAEGEWTEGELALLELLTDQLGEALESARLYHDTQRRAAREQSISYVVNRMRGAVDMETLMQTTIREVASALDVSSAFVQLGVGSEQMEGGDEGNGREPEQ